MKSLVLTGAIAASVSGCASAPPPFPLADLNVVSPAVISQHTRPTPVVIGYTHRKPVEPTPIDRGSDSPGFSRPRLGS